MTDTTTTDNIAADQLRSIIERIEKMEEEKADISETIRDLYTEAKGNGFDTKVLKRLVAYRKKDRDARQEEEAIFELYLTALGLV